MLRRLMAASMVAALALALGASSALAGGPPGPAIYVDGTLYRTVGTPTDFSATGAPAASFDHIYPLGNGLKSVADAKPGDQDFNGGRWMVFPVTWTSGVTPWQIMSDDELLQAERDGYLTIAASPAKVFECPVIPVGGAPA
jgi:hypothetical protein